jgi:hypothetical protein
VNGNGNGHGPTCPGCGDPAPDGTAPPDRNGGDSWWCMGCLNAKVSAARRLPPGAAYDPLGPATPATTTPTLVAAPAASGPTPREGSLL